MNPSSLLQGEDCIGSYGSCLKIERVVDIQLLLPERREAEMRLLSDMCLLYGVGKRHKSNLLNDGYTSIPSLVAHPRWGDQARLLLNEWHNPLDVRKVYETISRWLPSSSPLFLQILGLVPQERVLFFDLETLGLSNVPIILAALGSLEQGRMRIVQYLARSFDEEIGILEQVGAALERSDLLLSYNGKSFDWTYLRERFSYYGLPFPYQPMHIDLLHHARRAFHDLLPDVRLGTVEERILAVSRDVDLPSGDVPEYYTTYLDTQDPGPLVPIVNHNRQDIASLALLLDRLLWEPADGD